MGYEDSTRILSSSRIEVRRLSWDCNSMKRFFGRGRQPDNPRPPVSAWTRNEVEARLKQASPTAGAELAAQLQPAVRLISSAMPDQRIPIGASKFGGAPDLPRDLEWPTWRNPQGEDRPLGFYAQISLAEINMSAPAELGLGSSGLLSFFCDFAFDGLNGIQGLMPWEQPGCRIVHSSQTGLVRRKSQATTWPSGSLAPFPIWTRPPGLEGVDLPDTEFDGLDAFDQAYEASIAGTSTSGRHQFGGYAQFIQHPVEQEVVQALYVNDDNGRFDRERWEAAKVRVPEWRVVLQIDSDNSLDVMWGDVGILSWAARQLDIDEDNWTNAMFNFQCS